MNELTELRHRAYESSHIDKEKVKVWHDSQISRKTFEAKKKVWLLDAKLKLFPGKLRSKWTGPYIVHKPDENGSVDIMDPSTGAIFRVNGQRLKLCYEPSGPMPVAATLILQEVGVVMDSLQSFMGRINAKVGVRSDSTRLHKSLR